MEYARTRRVQRIHLAQPLMARLGANRVVLVDISVLGARVEHHMALSAGAETEFAFTWENEEIALECRIVRSRVDRFATGAGGLTVYHSGLEFEQVTSDHKSRLKAMIGRFITRALDEQKLNARGVLPQHEPGNMPIFRYGGQLTANPSDVKEASGSAELPISRVTRQSGYVSFHLENRVWRRKRTHDPGQPTEGFTISAQEDTEQAALLCEAYSLSDQNGRRMIQLFAQLSIIDGEGIDPGRFRP